MNSINLSELTFEGDEELAILVSFFKNLFKLIENLLSLPRFELASQKGVF